MAKAIGLPAWIREVGVVQICNLLGVNADTVQAWRRGTSLPKDSMKIQIVRVAKGRVTYQSMIEDHGTRNGWT